MYSIIVFTVLALYARQQGSFFLALLLLPSLFFYSLAYELKDSELSAEYFDYNRINDYSLYIIFGFILIFSVVVALNRRISGRAVELDPPAPMPPTSIRRATIIYYALSSVATIAFINNLSNVNFDIGLLFLNPRMYEEIFGQSTGVNYLYFLNVPALCISIYLRQQLGRPYAAGFVDAILISMSFFHGIKFTVFDTLLLPALFFFHCSRHPRRSLFVLGSTLIVLLGFYLAFSIGVRGFSEDEGPLFSAILNYILPNYYNLAYGIQVQPIQFDPVSILMPDKVPNPFLPLLFPGEYGFNLNDRFNMATAYANIYAILPPFSWLFFAPLLVRFRYHLIRLKRRSQKLHWVFVAAYIDFCIFFVWYFYAFNKTKYVYYLIVMFVVGGIVNVRTAPRLRTKIVSL
jgi:hypothetical protein